MDYCDIAKIGGQLFFSKMFGYRIPFQVHIRVLERCNQKCTYCQNDYIRRGGAFPTTNQLFEIIDGFAYLGTRRITITGGEPLLRDDIYDVVQRIKYHGIKCAFQTNGRLIDDNIEVIKNIDLLCVSLDGKRDIHDKYRGQGSYDAALRTVKIGRRMNIPVQLLCTVTKLTDPKLTHLTELTKRYKCSIVFDIVNPIFTSAGGVTFRPEDSGRRKNNYFLDYQLAHKNPFVELSPYVLKYVRDWPFSYDRFRLFKKDIPNSFKPIVCAGGRFTTLVESNGDLMPCCFVRPDYNPINIFEYGVDQAWKLMPTNDCITCRALGYNMLNSLFALNCSSIFHFIKRR